MERSGASISRFSGEFRDRARERRYRAALASAEVRQIRLVWPIALFFFALYAPLELRLFGGETAESLLFWRGMILLAGGCPLVATFAKWGRRRRDALTFVALAVVALCYAQLLSRREDNPGALLLLVIGTYLFSPGRFWLICLNGWLFALLAAVSSAPALTAEAWFGFSFLVPANLLAAVVLSRLNGLRRQAVLRDQRLRREILARQRAQAMVEGLHRRARKLLYNTLPAPIAEQLQREPGRMPADECEEATVLFADLVGFTRLAGKMPAAALLQLLNRLFSRFDELADDRGLEKIKTLGDAYMAAAGVTGSRDRQHDRAASMALAQLRVCRSLSRELGVSLDLRVGIHCGPLVSGVIGRRRLAFDVWGQTVNIASRLQTAADPGRILVSARFRQACSDSFLFGGERRLRLRGCGEIAASVLHSEASGGQLPHGRARRFPR